MIIEVKNETADRAAVGQALEYLAHFEGAGLEAVLSESDRDEEDLHQVYANTFGSPLDISAERRVILVAPAFSARTSVAVDYLARKLGGVTFSLLGANLRADGSYDLAWVTQVPIRTGAMSSGFAITPGGKLVYRLPGTSRPVFWRLGELCAHGRLVLAKKIRIEIADRHMHQTSDGIEGVDLSELGTCWRRGDESAQMFGRIQECRDCVDRQPQPRVVWARYHGDDFSKLQVRKNSDGWTHVPGSTADWDRVGNDADRRRPR